MTTGIWGHVACTAVLSVRYCCCPCRQCSFLNPSNCYTHSKPRIYLQCFGMTAHSGAATPQVIGVCLRP